MAIDAKKWSSLHKRIDVLSRFHNRVNRRHLVIGISPAGVCVMLLQGWGEPRIVEQLEQDVGVNFHWDVYLDALEGILANSKWNDLKCHIVLPEQWVRWVAIEWCDKTSPYMLARELQSMVKSKLTEQGEIPAEEGGDEWISVPNAPGYGQTQLGAAIPKDLYESLATLHAKYKMSIASCQSSHALAWNRWRSYDIDGRQIAMQIRVGRAQVFCTVDSGTLTISWRYRPTINIERGAPDFYKMAERTFDGVRSISIEPDVSYPVREIEQQLSALNIEGAVVTVVILGRKRRGIARMIRQGAEFWHLIDATNSGGISGGEVFCHLLSPYKSESALPFFLESNQTSKYGVLIDFCQSQSQVLKGSPAGITLRMTGLSFLLVALMGYFYFRSQVDALVNQVLTRPAMSVARKKNTTPYPETGEMKLAVQLSENLNWPWARFFERLNLGDRSEVVLKGVSLESNGSLRLSGDSRSVGAVQEFLESLERKHLDAVSFVVSESRMRPQNKGVRFDVDVYFSDASNQASGVCAERLVC